MPPDFIDRDILALYIGPGLLGRKKGGDTMSEANKALVYRFMEEIFNKGNLSVADEIVAVDYVNHAAPPENSIGPEPVKQMVATTRAAFPDMKTTIEEVVCEEDKVVIRATWRGSHQNEFTFFPGPPSGKSFAQAQIHIYRIADGKLAEHWEVADMLGWMQQLGFLPMSS